MVQLIIKNGTVINSNGIFYGDIAISDGKISMISQDIHLSAHRTIDAKGKFVLPGVIDSHVHLPWPSSSFNSVDDYTSGSTAAACGGVTTILEYAVPDESGRLLPTFNSRIDNSQNNSFVDFSLQMIIRKVIPETFQDMADLIKKGFPSFKIYMAYDGFRISDDDILKLMVAAKEMNALLCFHAEDGQLVNFATHNLIEEGLTDIKNYPEAHPREADIEATQRLIAYAEYTGARIHIVHVNTKEGATQIGEARRNGLRITGETCPHYLIFTEDVYKTGQPQASYYILSPAIRSDKDQTALWKAIANDDLQLIATDHCPYNKNQKIENLHDFSQIPGGASGIETSLQIIYTYGVKNNQIDLPKMVELMSTNPAKVFHLYPEKGIIAVGSDADLVIYDPNPISKIDAKKLHSNTDISIYQDMEVTGKPVFTILRGNIIAEDGKLTADEPLGKVIYREPYRYANNKYGGRKCKQNL